MFEDINSEFMNYTVFKLITRNADGNPEVCCSSFLLIAAYSKTQQSTNMTTL